MATPTEHPGHPDIDATEARQGRTGKPMLWVLITSTIAALLVVLLVWSFFSHRLGATSSPRVNIPARAAKLRSTTPAASPPGGP